MKKILFLIHDLGHGGAEKVLVNLVNHLDPEKFDVTVMSLFGGGVNEQFLKPHVRYKSIFKKSVPGNSHLMKLFSPRLLHRLLISEHYDVEVAYLEGPAARIISGCPEGDTKLVTWIHCSMQTEQDIRIGFRSVQEACNCFRKMDAMVFVSNGAKQAFLRHCSFPGSCYVLYNTNETEEILLKCKETAREFPRQLDGFRLIGVGKLEQVKGFDRLIRIHHRLIEQGWPIQTYLLGEGSQRDELEQLVHQMSLTDSVHFLGYQINPYRYVSKCSLFVCSSHSEGFSTAATEALIVGTPVCTVEVSGMKEMLGEHNEYGIVTENSEEGLYQGIRQLLDNPALLEHYRKQAAIRGKAFSTVETVKAVEEMLESL